MSARHQVGLTLIELMLALLIGLIIIAGVGEVFLAGRASYNVQQRLGDLQENGRFALLFLQRDIRQAGFPKNAIPTIDVFSTGLATPLTKDGGGNASDQISISYQADATGIGPTTDCLGQTPPVATPTMITNTYFIDTTKTRAKGQALGRLMCRGNGNAQAQPLVDGIENMQIQYGEDFDDGTANPVPAGYGYADRYVRADEVVNWNNVVSVRVAVLASTIDSVIGDDPSLTPTYHLLDVVSDALPGQVRARVFTTTVSIRNRTP
ncbi:MAG: PilW family protein [Stenotrophobium sp.]